MTLSPLKLERAFFRRLVIEAAMDAKAAPPTQITTTVSTGLAADNPLRIQVTLAVRLQAEPDKISGYTADVEVIGQFLVSDQIPAADRERISAIHGSTLLYGMVREMIANLTARGPWPMFVLPAVAFADLKPHQVGSTKP